MSFLINEFKTTQWPLIQYAEAVGWEVVSKEDALSLRGGANGLFFYAELEKALIRLNEGKVNAELAQSIIQKIESKPKSIEGNQEVLEWLRGNRTEYIESEKRYFNIALIDFANPQNNKFLVTYEWSFSTGVRKGNRADIVFLINGFPVAIVENKSPTKPGAMEQAIKQLRRYEIETPEMLLTPQVFNITHLLDYYYGVTWNYSRKGIFNWKQEAKIIPFPAKPINTAAEELLIAAEETPAYGSGEITYEQAVKSFFDQKKFLLMLKEWILFFVKDEEIQKTILRQHQTRAVTKVMDRCADKEKHRGLIWHTQGSGKTFTIITAARLILEDRERFPAATVMLIVDRNELEGQLSGWVQRLVAEMQGHQIVTEWATSKAKLQSLLDQDFRGLIISMIHKFDGIKANSCSRPDFFVLIDEAHRSTGGDLGNYLMGALPQATFIGFTGTPIDKTAYGRGTFKVFGTDDKKGYLDKYSIKESIQDGTTKKLRHALAPSSMAVPKDVLEKEFLAITESEGVADIDELNKILDRAVNLKTFLKSKDRIELVAKFVAEHFRTKVEPLGYKAFLVAVDREACAFYKQALDKYLPADYTRAVYTKNSEDLIERPLVAKYQLSEENEARERKLFPKAQEGAKIFIVTDKLLTGYDAPILYCMYMDKPMRDHVLLQAVARVNRPYEDAAGIEKPCGLIIDFIGIKLEKALSFDPDEINGVIEDLDLLMIKFKDLMSKASNQYLKPLATYHGDKLVERIIEIYFDPEKRQKYIETYKDIETLYEILSPDAELVPFMKDYNLLAEVYLIIRNKFTSKTTFWGEIARKTELMVRENLKADGLDYLTDEIEFDVEALKTIQDKNSSDKIKIINLIKAFEKGALESGEQEPYLISMADRALSIKGRMEARQISTQEAMDEIKKLMQARENAEKERQNLGLSALGFEVYFILNQEGLKLAQEIAAEISKAFERFPNFQSSEEEFRLLKAEMYKSLLREVKGAQMIDLTEKLLGNIRG